MRKINPDEVASFVKRAQELLVTGDLQAARFLLLRAAEAHDARAALYLAKTFDPIVSKQLGEGDLKPDLAQARKWYQKAEEWGAPEARRQLDALASYPP
jgi:TPR repeat protein